jgi:hypothetical protein
LCASALVSLAFLAFAALEDLSLGSLIVLAALEDSFVASWLEAFFAFSWVFLGILSLVPFYG